jgi:ornithine decarboxylase
VDLIEEAFGGLVVEGLSFHVGSQCTNFENFVQALNMAAAVMQEAKHPRLRDQDSRHRRRLPGPL